MTNPPPAIANLFPDNVRSALVDLRRTLHREPELSFHEEMTATRLEQALKGLGARDVRRVAGTGVLGTLPGSAPDGPVVAIRGDIDALPIQEDTGLEFASVHDGVMHACGHDVHATWAVGAAHLLAVQPAAGDVRILLQPAEETGRGAPAVLADGALEGVAAIFGGHVDRRFAVGQVVAEAGPLAAASDMFTLTLTGSGGHGARPHEARDPIVGGAALIGALQTVVARRINPADSAVVSVGSIHAGTAPNVIPDTTTITGTLRAVNADVRQQLHRELQHLVSHIAAAYRLEADLDIQLGTPPIVNTPEGAAWARDAVTRTLGDDALTPLGFLNMGGEDFAFYLEQIPGCFIRIGAREDGAEPIAAHTPRFYAAEESVFIGAAVLAETARRASADLAARR